MAAILIDMAYVLGLALTSPIWLWRMARHQRYRTGWRQRCGNAPVRHGLQPVIWIHAVSLGEVNGIRTLVDELASQLPDFEIVISSTTDTGMTGARKLYAPAMKVFQFPLDFSWSVRRAFSRLRPDLVVLMEGEIWPNFLAEANARDVPVVVVNGRMSENKGYPRYRMIKPFAKRLFNRLAVLAVQEEVYAERFISLGTDPERVTVTGTMKFDTAMVASTIDGADALARAVGVGPDDSLIVAGGTGVGEEALLLAMFAAMRADGDIGADTRLVIVPRKPERFDEVARTIEQAGFSYIRRSLRPDGIDAPAPAAEVILGDTMGELQKFYSLAAAVFVGRSLVPAGGSDMIEAAALAKPVAFGPHVFNFPQARLLTSAGVAREVADADELRRVLAGWLADPQAAGALGAKAQKFIVTQQGATRRNAAIICDLLGRTPAQRPGGVASVKLPDREPVEQPHDAETVTLNSPPE